MTTETFVATEDELELATQILVTRGCSTDAQNDLDLDGGGAGGGALQGDQAKEVFNRSALPFATLRVIWNMSSEKGNGVLSKYEIAKALRLIGWVQAGEILSEKLLVVAGPLPTLDGITTNNYSSPSSREGGGGGSPQIVVFPAVNEDQVREFRAAFWQAGPVNGLLSEDRIMNAYIMTSDLSYEDIRDIINLIDRSKRRIVDLTEFACGLYLVKALQSSQLHSLPATIPPDMFDQFADTSSGSFSSSSQLAPPPTYRRPPLPSSSSSSPPPPPPPPSSSPSCIAISPRPSRLSKPRMSNPPSPNNQPSPTSYATTNHMNNNNNNKDDWQGLSQHDRNMFELYFRKLDGSNKGYLEREAFDEFVSVYRVPATDLDRIWELTTLDRDGFMKRDQFTIAMHLVKQRSEGEQLPTSLPSFILTPSLSSSRRNTIAASSASSSLTLKLSMKKPPPPVPPKRRESLTIKAAASVSVSPPGSRPVLTSNNNNPFRQTMISGSSPKSPVSPPEKSPFDEPGTYFRSPAVNGISHLQSPPQPPPPPPLLPPPSPPAVAVAVNHDGGGEESLITKFRDEISRLSRQVEVLLGQLEAQNELRAVNDGLRYKNDVLNTQVKEMQKMTADILAVNETESAGSQEKYAQDITRLVGELGEKEAQCDEQERRLKALAEDEKELRLKMRESDGEMARYVAEAADYQRTIHSQRQQIEELNARVGDMTKVLADEPETNRRGGTTSNRELRVLIRDVTRENDNLKSEVRDMHRSMEQLLLSTKHAKYDEMELENRKLKKSVGELEGMVAQLQTSVGFSSSSSSVNNHRRQQSHAEDSVARENEQLKTQLQDGKRQFADFRSSSETKMVDLQQKVEELTRENNRLKLDIHDASEGRREDGSVPPPAYDDAFVPSG